MTHWLRKLVDDRRGNVFVLYAIAVPVILFAVGFAVDFGLAAQLRTRLNAAADAAALAALTPNMMTQTSATAEAAAVNMFNGQASALAGLAAGSVSVTVAITNPNNNELIRQVAGLLQRVRADACSPAFSGPRPSRCGNCAIANARRCRRTSISICCSTIRPPCRCPRRRRASRKMESLTSQTSERGMAPSPAIRRAPTTATPSAIPAPTATSPTPHHHQHSRRQRPICQRIATSTARRSTTFELAHNEQHHAEARRTEQRHLDPDVDRSDHHRFDGPYTTAARLSLRRSSSMDSPWQIGFTNISDVADRRATSPAGQPPRRISG